MIFTPTRRRAGPPGRDLGPDDSPSASGGEIALCGALRTLGRVRSRLIKSIALRKPSLEPRRDSFEIVANLILAIIVTFVVSAYVSFIRALPAGSQESGQRNNIEHPHQLLLLAAHNLAPSVADTPMEARRGREGESFPGLFPDLQAIGG